MGAAGPAEDRGRIQSVERAVALLEAVADASPEGETSAVLATRCALNRATAWRLLATLEDLGLVDRDPSTNRWTVGFAVTRLAASAGVAGLVRRAHPVLVRVSERTGETADLAVAQRLGLTYVDEVAPPSVLTANWLGRQVPLHATSSGKALLAWLPAADVGALLADPLPRYTATTVTSRRVLRTELDEIRRRGYGVCVGELEPTLNGVSAPVLDGRGRPVAVLSIWGPSDRVTPDRFAELGAVAREAADEVARAAVRGAA
ncbi:IclR family transcriptional regulator [Oryzihumus sp.]